MKTNSRIPKLIHYIWFGNKELSMIQESYIEMTRKMYPEYKIKIWGIEDLNVNENKYTKKAFEEKKYAFLSDYFRAKILYEHGGIYLDTDMVPINKVDTLLESKIVLGFEYQKMVSTGFVASIPNHPFFEKVISIYEEQNSLDQEKIKFWVNNELWTIILYDLYNIKLNNQEQTLPGDIKIYPLDYFSRGETGDNTFFLHDHKLSWTTKKKAVVMHFMLVKIQNFGKNIEVLLKISTTIWFRKNRWRFKKIKKSFNRY